MPTEYAFFVYIVSSRSRNLYIGVTNSLLRRVREHREAKADGFTARYGISRLVYFERFQYVDGAIAREKELKGWLRARKIALIEKDNPAWDDMFEALAAGRATLVDEGRKRLLRYAPDDEG